MPGSHPTGKAAAVLGPLLLGPRNLRTNLINEKMMNIRRILLLALLALCTAVSVQAQDYVNYIEKEIGTRIAYVSNGPKREEIIKR